MGLIPFKQRSFNDKTEIVDGVAMVVQFPTQKDDKGKGKLGWVLFSAFMSDKANLHKALKSIYGETIGINHPIRFSDDKPGHHKKGDLNPKAIVGKNCIATVGNTSKTEGKERIGIQNFGAPMDGMPVYQPDYSVEIPQYLINLKNGKLLEGEEGVQTEKTYFTKWSHCKSIDSKTSSNSRKSSPCE